MSNIGTDSSGDDFDIERINWESETGGSLVDRRDIAFAAAILGLLVFALYYHFVRPSQAPLPLVGFWDPFLVDWLFYASLLVFVFYVLVPLIRPGSVFRETWPDLVTDWIAISSLTVIVTFLLLGLFKPLLVGNIQFGPTLQPPVGFSIYEGWIGRCVGEVIQEQCQGTLAHPLGTNGNGQDILLLIIAGSRTALQLILITAAIIVPLGVGVGMLSGYFGGFVDGALMRYVDAQQTIPALFIYIALAVLYNPSLLLMVVVFGLLNWGDVARLVRSEVLQLKDVEFVTAARGAGVSQWGIIRHHVLPNVAGTVLTMTALKLPLLVIIEATLSFLEFGDPRLVSWGNIVAVGVVSDHPVESWWIGVFPIAALVLVAVAISLFGTVLQDALDPRGYRGEGL